LAAATALLGYWLTYRNNVRLAQRVERLARVNRQLGELYGPMLAIASIGDRVFKDYQGAFRPRKRTEPLNPNDPETRAWIEAVFMPNNRRLVELVLTKADLLVDAEMPDCLLQLTAHVSGYQAIMHRWNEDGYKVQIPPVPFPDDLFSHADSRFRRLRRDQRLLLEQLAQSPE